jgi:hypothetical protein
MPISRKPTPKLSSRQPSSPRSLSMVGHAPSVIGDYIGADGATDMDVDPDEEDFDAAISHIYRSFQGHDPRDVILSEKVENEACSMDGNWSS